MSLTINDNIPYLTGINAQRYVNKELCFCPYCLIAQTNIQKVKKLSKEFEKGYVGVVWNTIVSNDIKLFTKNDLMIKMDISDVSNGVLQDKALSILVVLGYLRKDFQQFIDKKGIKKERAVYIKKEIITPSSCYNPTTDSHIDMNWFDVGIKKGFKKE
jgi:hypothetical protein